MWGRGALGIHIAALSKQSMESRCWGQPGSPRTLSVLDRVQWLIKVGQWQLHEALAVVLDTMQGEQPQPALWCCRDMEAAR